MLNHLFSFILIRCLSVSFYVQADVRQGVFLKKNSCKVNLTLYFDVPWVQGQSHMGQCFHLSGKRKQLEKGLLWRVGCDHRGPVAGCLWWAVVVSQRFTAPHWGAGSHWMYATWCFHPSTFIEVAPLLDLSKLDHCVLSHDAACKETLILLHNEHENFNRKGSKS